MASSPKSLLLIDKTPEFVAESLSTSNADHEVLICANIELSLDALKAKAISLGKKTVFLQFENVSLVVQNESVASFCLSTEKNVFEALLPPSVKCVIWDNVQVKSKKNPAEFSPLKHFSPTSDNSIRQLKISGEKSMLIPKELFADITTKLKNLDALFLGKDLFANYPIQQSDAGGICDNIISLANLPNLKELAIDRISTDEYVVANLFRSVGALITQESVLLKLEILLIVGVQVGDEIQLVLTDNRSLPFIVIEGHCEPKGNLQKAAEGSMITASKRPTSFRYLKACLGGSIASRIDITAGRGPNHTVIRIPNDIQSFLSDGEGKLFAKKYWITRTVVSPAEFANDGE